MEIQGLQPYTDADADTPADISNDDYQHWPNWLSAAERAVADAVEKHRRIALLYSGACFAGL